jgi:transcriptional regulator with XRE-family HTH domain
MSSEKCVFLKMDDIIATVIFMKKGKSNKKKPYEFGERLIGLRKARGLTQTELGKKIGISKRMVAYYEGQTKRPPAHLLIPIARALRISVEELLGVKKLSVSETNHAALWRRLKKVEMLSKSDQKALLKMIDGLVAKSKINK